MHRCVGTGGGGGVGIEETFPGTMGSCSDSGGGSGEFSGLGRGTIGVRGWP